MFESLRGAGVSNVFGGQIHTSRLKGDIIYVAMMK